MGEDDDKYTKDGTVDHHGNPADKSKTGNWKACPFILGNECCERLAYYGMRTNLILYFKNRLHQHSATASNNVSNWGGTCYITPLIGAFIADSYLGRYWTIALFSVIYVILSLVHLKLKLCCLYVYFRVVMLKCILSSTLHSLWGI
nr:protein nrt1/ ptr family 8.1 [Quercus suber]